MLLSVAVGCKTLHWPTGRQLVVHVADVLRDLRSLLVHRLCISSVHCLALHVGLPFWSRGFFLIDPDFFRTHGSLVHSKVADLALRPLGSGGEHEVAGGVAVVVRHLKVALSL